MKASELYSYIAGMMKISNQKLKTMTKMLSALMDKVDNMQEQVGNVS